MPALPALIVGLQDADKIGHARPVPVVSHIESLSRRGLTARPNPPQKIGDQLHGVYSQPFGWCPLIPLRRSLRIVSH
jgi:hypothetical protein